MLDTYTVQTWDTAEPEGAVEFRAIEANSPYEACSQAVDHRWQANNRPESIWITSWVPEYQRMMVHLSGGRRVTRYAAALRGDML